MPQALHAELAARSDRDGVSLNQWIVSALTEALAGDGDATDRPRGMSRQLRIALIANAVVVGVAAVCAVALIIVALR